jgi:hypothetical protein
MSVLDRYERYVTWCRLLGYRAADFDTWRREMARISELNIVQ